MQFIDAQNNSITLPKGEPVYERRSVYAVVFRNEKLLVYMPKYNEQWQLPGGGIDEESNENLNDALIRECLEETGYAVAIIENQPIYIRKQNFYQRSIKKFYHSQQFFFKASLDPKDQTPVGVSEEDKNGKVEWIPLSELNQQNIHPTLIELLKILEEKAQAD